MTQVLHETRGPVALVTLVGLGHAAEMCLSGRLYSAAEAERIGLVNRVVAPERLVDEALARAGQIAGRPRPQARWIKAMLARNAANGDLGDVLRTEARYLDLARRSPEHAAAVRAFVERRSA